MRGAGSAFILVMTTVTAVEQTRPPAASAQNGLIATLTFAKDAGTAIYLPVRVNGGGVQYWALDSGASECIVDRSVARQARLTTRGGRDIHGAGKGAARLDSISSPVRLEIAGRSLSSCDHFGTLDLTTASDELAAACGRRGSQSGRASKSAGERHSHPW